VDDLRIAYFPNAIPTVIFADLIKRAASNPDPPAGKQVMIGSHNQSFFWDDYGSRKHF